MENLIFKYALLMSLAVHAFTGIAFVLGDLRLKKTAPVNRMEVVYQAAARPEEKQDVRPLQLDRLPEERSPRIPEPLPARDIARMSTVPALEKAPAPRIESVEKSSGIPLLEPGEKRQIHIPVLDSDKMMGPRYVTYNEQIREKIRSRAYFYVDDPRFETGEVYLTFVLGSDGGLKDVKVIPDRTRANAYLRTIGLRSIQESSPFPRFPGDLDYPELSFNVLISFERGK